MFKKKHFIFPLIFIATAVLLLLAFYKGQDIKLQPSFQTSSMHDLHMTLREDQVIKWELSAREAVFPVGSREVFLKSLGVKINRDPEILLAGGSGVYLIDQGNVNLAGSVELNIKNTKFTTDSLTWDSKAELITTQDPIRFTGANFLIEGSGLAASVKQQKIRILKNVKATFNLT